MLTSPQGVFAAEKHVNLFHEVVKEALKQGF